MSMTLRLVYTPRNSVTPFDLDMSDETEGSADETGGGDVDMA